VALFPAHDGPCLVHSLIVVCLWGLPEQQLSLTPAGGRLFHPPRCQPGCKLLNQCVKASLLGPSLPLLPLCHDDMMAPFGCLLPI
jgi:hypothetical protein